MFAPFRYQNAAEAARSLHVYKNMGADSLETIYVCLQLRLPNKPSPCLSFISLAANGVKPGLGSTATKVADVGSAKNDKLA